MSNVVALPNFTRYGPQRENERLRLRKMFAGKTVEDMRRLWDSIEEDGFYHGPEGDFDCTDIHSYMNMIGDGEYCAV